MDILVLSLFCAVLIGSIVTGISVIPALLIGLALFIFYGKIRGFSLKELFTLCFSGVKTAANILLMLLLIGALTALWRASGCIPAIVTYASTLIRPSVFILVVFLLCCLVSVLTGTSFGTSATIGVICMSIARSMGISEFWTGGAILAGAFFGDRCSPMSTSALLVSTVTKTDIYNNIKGMVKTAAVPFAAACLIYLLAGFLSESTGGSQDAAALFVREFKIHPLCLLPALSVVITSCLKLKVRYTMMISIFVAFLTALFVQEAEALSLLKAMFLGFEAKSEELQAMMNGGGILSMVKVSAIVCIASCYSGIFKATGLLNFMKKVIHAVAEKAGSFRAVLLTSIPACMIGCNQTLAIMLTRDLCDDLGKSNEELAIDLENTAVVIAALVPWSIAGSVPLATVGAPMTCMFAACYLYLLPLWHAVRGK